MVTFEFKPNHYRGISPGAVYESMSALKWKFSFTNHDIFRRTTLKFFHTCSADTYIAILESMTERRSSPAQDPGQPTFAGDGPLFTSSI